MSITLLYDDALCAVIDKPTGLPVMDQAGGIARSVQKTFPHWQPVHRLDNDTSGCLLLAKSDAAFALLREQFDERTVRKHYTAWVHGTTPGELTITDPIAHHGTKKDRMVIMGTGAPTRGYAQDARTVAHTKRHIYPSASCPIPLSLLEIEITTGVRHQIRVHLASRGHGVAGDTLYGGAKLDLPIKHHLLHASRLEFTHPASGIPIAVDAPLPDRFTIAT